MSRIHILVEGQTEETFVRDVLYPHLAKKGIYPSATLATTKRVKKGPRFQGGIVSYEKVKNDIKRLLSDTNASLVTTMIDYYGHPDSFPGKTTLPDGSCYRRVTHLEESFGQDVNDSRFLPYFELHEFEAMLFVYPDEIARQFPGKSIASTLKDIRSQFNSPEEIDDGPTTAPSKRLKTLFPSYQKPLHGPLVTLSIGIEAIRRECHHFNDWLTNLEAFEKQF